MRSLALWCCAVLFVVSVCVAVWFLAVPDHIFGLIFVTPGALFLLILAPVGFGLATFVLALSLRYPEHSSKVGRRPDRGGGA
jgi:type VI protein secretion system component VasK